MSESFYNNQTKGIQVQYMWFGQVVDESTWVENNAREDGTHSLRDRDDFQGYGYRAKVRIFGRELEDKTSENTTKDEELYMAEVALPVTAGSGHGGLTQTPSLTQGNYVFGFYKDGIEGTEPIVFGILPNHAQTRLFGNDPEKGFFSRTGYQGKRGNETAWNKNVLGQGPDSGVPTNESAGLNYVLDVRDIDVLKEQRTHYLPKTYDCDIKSGGALTSIQKIIKDVQATINKIKAAANSFAGVVSDVLDGVNSLIEDAALLIADLMKGIIDKMRGFAENLLNKGLNLIIGLLPPDITGANNEIAQLVLDVLACLFNKIISQLFQSVLGQLKSALSNSLSTPLCAVENFMGGLLGGILGPLADTLSSIGDLLGSVVDGISGIMSGIFSALDTILGVISFLTCDEDADCSAGDGWSFWYGDAADSVEIPELSNIIQTNAFSGGEGGGGGFCDSGPTLAKPPRVKFKGGGGTGAIANPIITPDGRIIAIDVIDGGTGYTSNPQVVLNPDDGPGSGVVLYPVLESDNSFLGGTGGEASGNPSNKDDISTVTQGIPGALNFTVTNVPLTINSESTLPTFEVNPVTAPGQSVPPGNGETLIVSSEPIKVGATGGIPIRVDFTGNPVTVTGNTIKIKDGRSLVVGNNGNVNAPQVITNAGPMTLGGDGGKEVKIGGKNGTNLFIPSGNIITGSILTFTDNGVADSSRIPNATGYTVTNPASSINGSGSEFLVVVENDGTPKISLVSGGFNYIGGGVETVRISDVFLGNGGASDIIVTVQTVGTPNINTKIPIEAQVDSAIFQSDARFLKGPFPGTFEGKGTYENNKFKGEGLLTGKDDKDEEFTLGGNFSGFNSSLNGSGSGTFKGEGIVKNNRFIGQGKFTPDKPTNLSFSETDGTETGTDGSGTVGTGTDGSGTVGTGTIGTGTETGTDGSGTVGTGTVGTGTVGTGTETGTDGSGTVGTGTETGGNLTDLSGLESYDGSFSGPDGSPIKEVIVLDSGIGYLQKPDGSIYADGVQFSKPEETIILNPNTGYNVYVPNSTIPVLSGDSAFLPPGSEVVVYDDFGNPVQSLFGLGQETAIPIEKNGTITTPTYDPENILTDLLSSGDGKYPAVLKIVDVLIANPGFNYSSGDEIIIQPKGNAELEPFFDKFGRLSSVNINSPGTGWNEVPKIYIQSNTGLNAVIIPIFGVTRIGDLNELDDIVDFEKAIEVIDCVGKIAERKGR